MENTGCRPLTASEFSQILSALSGRHITRDRAWLVLGKFTGYRISELLSLRTRDVWDGASVRPIVTVAKAYMKGRRASRTIPIHPEAAIALTRWILDGKLTDNPNGSLFPSQGAASALTPGMAWVVLKKAVARAGISTHRVALHSLRKTFASAMWESPHINHDMAKMARVLGHTDFSNTLRYLQFLDNSLEEAVLSAA